MKELFKTTALCLLLLSAWPVAAQSVQPESAADGMEVFRDTTWYNAPTTIEVERETIFDPMRVVTNKFSKDWFLYGDVGLHTFRGDYSGLDKFSGTLSPEFELGFGKWFTPGIAVRASFIYSNTRGYAGVGSEYFNSDAVKGESGGIAYSAMKFGWWDINAGVEFNLSRMFGGYEGYGSRKMMNQIFVYAGLGLVHHTGYSGSYGSNNELSAHTELKYSRFFTPSKRISLDLRLRGTFYQSNHDGEYGQADYAARKVDYNLSASLGVTFYLSRGWGHSTTKLYVRDYTERSVTVVREREAAAAKIEYGTITFYVFYPNNYSGRDDAPIVDDATVNAIDYLAGGIFTQMRYANNGQVASRLAQHLPLYGLATENITTERADRDFAIDYVPRGYEMTDSAPMSLSLLPEDMIGFRDKAGFYYAPIFDGKNVWLYRIDKAAMGQRLLSDANYAETESFGLNAHGGLDIVRRNMNIDGDDQLVSFADVYAAINENEGYISKFTDAATVEHIKRVLNNGVITMIQAEGAATSQDNYSGADASRIRAERNTALSQNRANTVVKWLKSDDKLNDVASQIYLVNSLSGPVRQVDDASTRGLNAKLNRCVKVRIHYMMK